MTSGVTSATTNEALPRFRQFWLACDQGIEALFTQQVLQTGYDLQDLPTEAAKHLVLSILN